MTVPRFYAGCHNKFIQKPAVYFGSPGGELSAQRTEGWLPTQGLRQHRTIPALRLKHRFGGCGTASALPKCSIMSGCGTRIVLRGQKPLALCDRCPCFGSLFPPLAALTFAASSIICAFGLASAAPRSPYRHLELCGIALKICILPGRNNGVTYLTGKAPGIKFICRGRCSSSACMAGRKWHFTLKYCKRSRAHNARPCGVK